MSESAYQDYGWQSAGPANSADGDALARLFRDLALGIGKGLSVCDLGCGNGYGQLPGCFAYEYGGFG